MGWEGSGNFSVREMSHILIGVMVTWVCTLVKPHQMILLESVQFAVGKFYH